MKDFLKPLAELQEAKRRLHNIRETEAELDSWFQVLSAGNPQPMAKQSKIPSLAHAEGGRMITQKNRNFQQQGPSERRDFP